MDHGKRGTGAELDREVAIRHGVERVRADPLETQLAGDARTVDRKRGAGQGGGAQGEKVHAATAIREARAVAFEHLEVSEQMMSEGDRLGHLKMRESRHHGGDVLFRLVEERPLNLGHEIGDLVDRVAQPQPQIRRDLVVARSRRVQPLARLSDEVDEPPLDIEMHVLGLERPAEASRLDLLGNPGQAALDRLEISPGQDPGGAQHARVGKGRPDVVEGETTVKADGGGVALDELGHRFGEAPRPEFLARLGLQPC
jgi:hypothetical protein